MNRGKSAKHSMDSCMSELQKRLRPLGTKEAVRFLSSLECNRALFYLFGTCRQVSMKLGT